LTYRHPDTRRRVRIDEVVRVPNPEGFRLRPGERGAVECWGFLPNGRLRHPMWLGWASETPEPNGRAGGAPSRRR
jgi:hypothetical protein